MKLRDAQHPGFRRHYKNALWRLRCREFHKIDGSCKSKYLSTQCEDRVKDRFTKGSCTPCACHRLKVERIDRKEARRVARLRAGKVSFQQVLDAEWAATDAEPPKVLALPEKES